MIRRIILSVLALAVLGGVGLAGLGLGYFTHREKLEPWFGYGERIVVKGRRELGMPTEVHAKVDRIDTTFLTLRGKVHLMPENDYRNGGGLTLWGDEIIVMHSLGNIFVVDEETGFERTRIEQPDNGLDGYVKLAAEKYPGQPTKAGAIRFNDLEFIDSEVFRGLVISYTYIDAEKECYVNRISKLEVPADVTSIRDLDVKAEDWEVLYDTPPCLEFNPTSTLVIGYMSGGRVVFKAPNLLYMGSGEYYRDGMARADAGIQDDATGYGKTIEIDLASGASRIFSKGHRNLQGMEIDLQGRLWTTEHGMRGGDELNLIKEGENYGWPLENLGTLYNGLPAPGEGAPGRHEIYAAPVYAWLPSAAVSSLALVDGFHEAWDGDLLIGSLKQKTLYRARIRGERVVFLEEIKIGQRIRDVMQVASDKIALWLDSNEVVILTIEPRVNQLEGMAEALAADGMEMAMATRVAETFDSCNECHSYEQFIQGAGPTLYGVIDRDIATTAFAGYSDALRSLPGTWDRERLAAYLVEPEAIAPGTGMTGMGVGDPELAAAIVKGFDWVQSRARKTN